MKLYTKQNLLFSTLVALLLSSQAVVAAEDTAADNAQEAMVTTDAADAGDAGQVPELADAEANASSDAASADANFDSGDE